MQVTEARERRNVRNVMTNNDKIADSGSRALAESCVLRCHSFPRCDHFRTLEIGKRFLRFVVSTFSSVIVIYVLFTCYI